VGSAWREVSNLVDNGLDEALISSSSVITDVGLAGRGGSGGGGGEEVWGRDVGGASPDLGVGTRKETLR
jgi:hypothetical protein